MIMVTTFSFFVAISLLCFIFLRLKFKRFNQGNFCDTAALKLPKKQIEAFKNAYEGAHFTEI